MIDALDSLLGINNSFCIIDSSKRDLIDKKLAVCMPKAAKLINDNWGNGWLLVIAYNTYRNLEFQ